MGVGNSQIAPSATFYFFNVYFYLASACSWLQKPEVQLGSPGAGTIGDCELPDISAGNQTPV